MAKQATAAEEATGDPAVAGEATVDLVEATGLRKAAQHWQAGTVQEFFSCWWTVVDDRWGKMEVMQMGEVWWRQKQQSQRKAALRQWQQMAAVHRTAEAEVAEVAEAETTVETVEAAATEEAVVDTAVGAGEATIEAVAAAEAGEASEDADWLEVLEVVRVVQLGEQRELERAAKDVQQWVLKAEQQAAAGEAEVLGAMVEAATEAAAKGQQRWRWRQ